MEKQLDEKKWGVKNKFIFKPKWARWKLHLQISETRWREYYSYDYHNVWVNGVKQKCYRERLALIDMIERVREKNPSGYKYANVFGNFSNDLSTDKKNFNYHVYTMTPIKCTWKQEIFYSETPIPGSGYIDVRVDVRKTLDHWKGADTELEKKVSDRETVYTREMIYKMIDEKFKDKIVNPVTLKEAREEIDKILNR